MKPRVAIYLRVSTDNQTHDSQRKELEEYCARRNWTNLQWFTDTASGAKQDRSGLNELMGKVRRGKVDIVLAYKLDRLARSLNHLAQMIAEFRIWGTALVVPSQAIDTTNTNPAAQFQLNILAAVAEFERELITERVKAGVKAAQQRGIKLGRPSKKQRYLGRVKELMARGLGSAQISRELNIPRSTAGDLVRELKAEGNLPSPCTKPPNPSPEQAM